MIHWEIETPPPSSTDATTSGSTPLRTGSARAGASFSKPIPQRGPAVDAVTDPQALKQTIQTCIGNSLVEVERSIAASLISKYDHVQQLVTRANAMAGKRLRPILVLLSAQASETASRFTLEQVVRNLIHIATATELVHMASLVHDDVMDQAHTRRHQPTIYRTAGEHAALLLGDFLFTRGYATASNCKSTFPARKLATAATQLCEGELRQQASARNWNLSVNEYLSIIGQKTASLCAVSCRLGAWQIGAPPQVQRSLHRFGHLLGLAFQVFDDWLDYWGSDQAGKTLGTDLAQLKPTLPLIKFLQSSSPACRQQLLDWATSPDNAERWRAYEMIRQSDAGHKTLSLAQELVERAISVLHTLPDSRARSALQDIACFSIRRTA